jgi:tRNA (cytidine/uridine-2'-O-)-methyltransferase
VFNVVLVHPQIPPNTGNVIRLCANTGARLHMVQPMGFPIDHAKMRRAGLDYHEFATLQVHPGWAHLRAAMAGGRAWALTTGGHRRPDQVAFARDDWLVFGSETDGLPPDVLAEFDPHSRLRLPMRPGNRSLNLSNAVAVTVFEAWRQFGYEGMAPS